MNRVSASWGGGERARERASASLFPWGNISLGLAWTRCLSKELINFPNIHRLWLHLHALVRLRILYGLEPPEPPAIWYWNGEKRSMNLLVGTQSCGPPDCEKLLLPCEANRLLIPNLLSSMSNSICSSFLPSIFCPV